MANNIIALDIGEKRIGVAIADISAPFPSPLTTLETTRKLLEEFHQLLKKHNVRAVVIGLPRNQSGETTHQTQRVQKIAILLQVPKDVPIYWQDESLTSVKAEEELQRRKRSYTKAEVDALSATYILNDFVQSQEMAELAKSDGSHINNNANKNDLALGKNNQPKKKPKKRKARAALVIGLVSIFLIVAAVVGCLGWYSWAISPVSSSSDKKIITITEGSTSAQIAAKLHEQSIIKSSKAFTWYVKLNKVNDLRAGSYELSGSQSVKEIIEILRSGKVSTNVITILPGKRIDQIFTELEKHGFSEADLNKALVSVKDHKLLESVPDTMKLEGYLFPDTYHIDASMDAEDMLRLMLDTFQNKLDQDGSIASGLKKQNVSFSQAVIIASVVQNEVRDYDDQQKVAQVFLRRFREGMPLGADPTFRYAAAVEGGPANPSNSSKYNTRIHAGLPPSAISNFNISALKAVANPSDTNYLYFVAGDDGTTHFSYTLEEHQSLTNRYCTTLCQ